MPAAVTVGSAIAYLELNTSRFTDGINRATTAFEKFEQNAQGVTGTLDRVGSSIKSTGTAMTAAVTLPIIGTGTAAIRLSADFDAAMSKVQAISGATADELKSLYYKAIEMGAATKFSAKESAEAFTYMAMAGWNTEEMLNGISGIMSLAAADGLDLATTSDIVTDALTAFGLQASDSAYFADILAAASSSANTNVQMLGESFKYVAPVAGALGFSVEDTALALSLMANSGIKGSQAGTSLRAAIASLTKPTDETARMMKELGIEISNSDGSMKELIEIMEILRTAFKDLSESEQANAAATLFGREAMSAMLAIVNASEEDFYGLSEAIANSQGRADEMAKTMMNNVSGAIEQLKGALESLAIKIGSSLTPIIQQIATFVTTIVEKLNTMSEKEVEQIVKIAALIAAIGPLLVILGSAVSGLAGFASGIMNILAMSPTVLGVLASIAVVFAGILSQVSMVISVLIVWSSIIKSLMNSNKEFAEYVTNAWNKIKSGATKMKEVISNVIGTFVEISNRLKETFLENSDEIAESLMSYYDALYSLYTRIQPILHAFAEVLGGEIILAISTLVAALDGLISAYSHMLDAAESAFSILNDIIGIFVGVLSGDFESVKLYVEDLISQLTEITESLKAIFTSFGEGFTETFKETLRSLFEAFGISIDEAKESIKEKVSGILPAIQEGIQGFLDEAPEKLGIWVGTLIAKVQQLSVSIISWIRESFPIWQEEAKKFLQELPSKLWTWLVKLHEKVLNLGPKMHEAGKSIFTSLWDGLKSVWSSIKSWLDEVKEVIGEFLTGIAKGYNEATTAAASSGFGISGSHSNGLAYVPYNGYIAELHEGERILTKEENKSYRQQDKSSGDTFIFQSPKAIDEYEAARLLRQTKEELDRDF